MYSKIIKTSGLIALYLILLNVNSSAQKQLYQTNYNYKLYNPESVNHFLSSYCELIAERKDYFTYVLPPAKFLHKESLNKPESSTITVVYNGFSAEAQTAFQFAIDILETEITSPVTINIVANWTALGDGILGSAGANYFVGNFPNAPITNTFYPAALANKLAGSDLYPANHDIIANFSSAFSNWYFGTDGNTPSEYYDFVSVVMHEIIHGLGFAGSMTVTGNQGSWGIGTPKLPIVYDHFTVNGNDQQLINTTLFNNPSTALGNQLKSDNLFFNGAGSIFANGGTKPKLFAPSTWQQGSSYSHWNETTYLAGNINSLMTPAIGSAEAIHHPGFITRGLLQDIGWTIDQPLPVELSSFTVNILGNYIQLLWSTETEKNNYGFEVQRKIENSDWIAIGFINGYGNSNSPKEYSFKDNRLIGGSKFQYRLKQIDNDGQFEYSDVVEAELVPTEFALYQNYPNPFNPSTTIRYQLPKESKVVIKIYNVLGSEVMELLNEQKEAGIYEVEFNAETLSSGTYVYKIASDNFVQTKKMILLK